MRVFRFLHVCAAGLVAVFLTGAAPSRAERTAPKTAAAKAAPARTSINWRAIVAGEAEAKKKGKPALYFFTADWCGPCHLLEDQVFAVPDVAAQVEKDFVPIVVQDRMRETGRNAPEMLALADRYGLRGFPTLVVSRPKLATNVTLEGWEGRGAAVEFLRSGKKRFLDVEKKPGVKK
ncbi:MAG: thioredoxin family protein [Thermoanaerobaculia bacterium]|nr:thioredoxin family protein [Thermoanaerobaculia bacterium]